MGKQTDEQTNGQKNMIIYNKNMVGQIGKQQGVNMWMEKHKNGHTDKSMDKHTDGELDKHMDGQSDIRTDEKTYRCTQSWRKEVQTGEQPDK